MSKNAMATLFKFTESEVFNLSNFTARISSYLLRIRKLIENIIKYREVIVSIKSFIKFDNII